MSRCAIKVKMIQHKFARVTWAELVMLKCWLEDIFLRLPYRFILDI